MTPAELKAQIARHRGTSPAEDLALQDRLQAAAGLSVFEPDIQPPPYFDPRKTIYLPGEPVPEDAFVRQLHDGRIEVLYRPTSEKHKAYHASSVPKLIMEGRRGTGKALALDTPIPTPTGWATMASLCVGDQVLDDEGHPTRVLWKSEPHTDETGTYRLTFDDGSEVVCGGNHEWLTTTRRERASGASTIRRTTEIADTVKVQRGRETNHRVKMGGAWQLPQRPLPLSPYVLGVWLGDGSKGTGWFTTADAQMVDLLHTEGEAPVKCRSHYAWLMPGLYRKLRLLSVLKRKHIPSAYLRGSAAQRLALLQGLMDTDGWCDARQGTVEFCNTNKGLADGVFELAVSLGIKPTLTEGRAVLRGRDCGPKYRVTWTSTVPVFRLSRKLARLPQNTRATQSCRYIVKAERIETQTVQCIEVENPSHLYLVGKTAIPSHNSHTMRWDMHMRAMAYPGFKYLMLRRTMPELRKSHILFLDTDMDKLGGRALGLRSGNVECHYPKVGGLRSLGLFGHCETDADVMKYLSAQFDAIIFDEITTFEWDMFTKICTSCRVVEGSGLTALVRGGTNPIGVSAEEVYRYFIEHSITPEEEPHYAAKDWGSIKINQADAAGTVDFEQYDKQFVGLDKAYRTAWLDGQWGVDGAYFDVKERNYVPSMPVIMGSDGMPPMRATDWPWLNIYRVLDWGWHDPTVCVWIAVLPNGRAIPFMEKAWLRTPAPVVASEMKELSGSMKVITTIAEPKMWDGEKEMGHCLAFEFEDLGISMTKGRNDRVAAGYAIQEYLNTILPDGLPKLLFINEVIDNTVKTPTPTLIRTLKAMRVDKKHPGRIADHKADHMPIALGYFCQTAPPGTQIPKTTTLRPWMQPQGATRRILGSAHVRRKR